MWEGFVAPAVLWKPNDVTSFYANQNGKHQLAVNAIEYPHSSANFYICGTSGNLPGAELPVVGCHESEQ